MPSFAVSLILSGIKSRCVLEAVAFPEQEELVQEYFEEVKSRAYKYAEDHDLDYDDTLSAALDSLNKAASHYDEQRGGFGAFLHTVLSRDLLRLKISAERRPEPRGGLDDAFDHDDVDPGEHIEKQREREMLDKSLAGFNDEGKRAIEMYNDGASLRDIANELGMSRTTAGNIVSRYVHAARSEFRKAGYEVPNDGEGATNKYGMVRVGSKFVKDKDKLKRDAFKSKRYPAAKSIEKDEVPEPAAEPAEEDPSWNGVSA